MVVRIGSNIASFQAQRRFGEASSSLSSSYERLSSGQRINRASDDAAGLSIAESLRADARVFNQAIRNVNDGISVISIADGAHSQLSLILNRITELAQQAANGSYSNVQRKALDREAKELRGEYHRIIETTTFNGQRILSDSAGTLSLQAGSGTLNILSSNLQAGQVEQENVARGMQLDGINDYALISYSSEFRRFSGDFTLEAWIYKDDADMGHLISRPTNGSGVYNYRFLIEGNGRLQFTAGNSYYEDVISTSLVKEKTWTHVAATRAADGTTKLWINGQNAGTGAISDEALGLIGVGDYNLAVAVGTVYPYSEGWAGNTSYSFKGAMDEVRISSSVRYTENFTPQSFAFATDSSTLALLHFEEPNGATQAVDSSSPSNQVLFRNGAATGTLNAFESIDYGPLFDFTLTTQGEALRTLDKLSEQAVALGSSRAMLGAFERRLNTAAETLLASKENYLSAESRIRDADIAQESTKLLSAQILQQSASAILAQANQAPALALSLLS